MLTLYINIYLNLHKAYDETVFLHKMSINNNNSSDLLKNQGLGVSTTVTSSKSNSVNPKTLSEMSNVTSNQSEVTADNLQSTSKKTNSFSKVVSYSMFPKKNQAILIDTVDGIELKAYIKAISTKTLPTNIVAASKISQNRFCCYLNSEKLVDELTREGNNEIEINGHKLYVRPYVSKAKRVIFSNVHPCIPHDEIIAVLTAKGISPESNMSFIRLGFEEEGFTQILSFRRQPFIDPSDVNKLPSVITVNYDDTLHNVYISTDKIVFYLQQRRTYSPLFPYCQYTANHAKLSDNRKRVNER